MQYDFNVPANGGQVLDVKGKFFKYKTGIGAIRVKTNHGGYVDLLPGQGIWNTDFSSIIIQDRSGATNTGVLLAGDFDFHDDRISGTVEVIDGVRNRTTANQAFMGIGYAPAVVSRFSMGQLWNPPASGKRLVVGQVNIIGTAGTVSTGLGMWNTRLANTTTYPPVNKNNGGSASVATSWYEDFAAPPLSVTFGSVGVTAINARDFYKFAEPVVISPGQGLVMQCGVANNSFTFFFEWFEESL